MWKYLYTITHSEGFCLLPPMALLASSLLSNVFGAPCELDLQINAEPSRKKAPVTRDKKGDLGYIFTDGEDVCGTATVRLKGDKRLEHQGIRVELIGQVDMLYDRTSSYDFFSITKDLEPPGVLTETRSYKWKFSSVDKTCETYSGINVRLRYFVRNVSKEVDFAVQLAQPQPEMNTGIKMEVGIEDCLHIEFEYSQSKFNLKDVVVGKVYFLLVRLKIKHMELDIIRREVTGAGAGSNQLGGTTDNETVTKFEIMDGSPVRAECIPVRLYLSGFDLTPTYKNVQNKFSVRYFLNLVLVDEEDRRYFKQQEITLWRKTIG